MKYIRIKNDGLIEPEALHLVGASTKTNDSSKIGQFGSGNKYAMAYLLRNDYDILIYSGMTEIKITTEPSVFRDETFHVVHIDGQKTSITTQMGKDWMLWQAIREIYCNAMDEGKHDMEFVGEINPAENETHFYISNRPEMMQFIANFDSYFVSNKKLLFECEVGRIYEHSGESVNVFRKGIRCFDDRRDSLYDYDFNEIDINESRVVTSSYDIYKKMWEIIFKCTNKSVIKNIVTNLSNQDRVFEGNMYGLGNSCKGMSEEFKDVLRELKLVPFGYAGMLDSRELMRCTVVPTLFYKTVENVLEEINKGSAFQSTEMAGYFKEFKPDALQKATLNKGLDFFNECNFKIPYTIIIAEFENKQILGAAVAENSTIYISDICLTKGINEIVNTIIEEFIHLKYEAPDETRRFQDSIIAEFIDYMKKSHAYSI